MKYSAFFIIFLALTPAFSSELTILGGAANSQLDMVNSMIKDVVINDDSTDTDLVTKWLSILSRSDIASVNLVVSDPNKWNYDTIAPALELASQMSSVVLAPVTPMDGFLCLQMKKQTKTLFVLPAGDNNLNLDPPGVGVKWCQAPNLIFVGALNGYSAYLPTSNYGPDYVRVAAPGYQIKVLNDKGMTTIFTGSLASAAIVAAQAAHFSAKYPRLKGYKLAHKFIQAKTQTNKKFTSSVNGGRVILKNSFVNSQP